MTAAPLVQQTIRVCLGAVEDNARIEIMDDGLELIVRMVILRGDEDRDAGAVDMSLAETRELANQLLRAVDAMEVQ